MENVGALLSNGIDQVLGSLSEIGYDAEWQVISASDIGAPHRRERIWIIAYPRELGCNDRGDNREERHVLHDLLGDASESKSEREGRECGVSEIHQASANAMCKGLEGGSSERVQAVQGGGGSNENGESPRACYAWSFAENSKRKYGEAWEQISGILQQQFPNWNQTDYLNRNDQPSNRAEVGTGVTRMDDGVSAGVERPKREHKPKSYRKQRLTAVGNAIVPQIAKMLFEITKEKL